MTTTLPFDPATATVNDVLLRWPAAVGPLKALGVHTCCGGAKTLVRAASDDGVPLPAILDAVAAVAAEG